MRKNTTRSFPPLGQLYKVNSHSLHLFTKGEGSPTVLLEAGGASWSLDWHPVQEMVATFTRVCSYDRAGFGWSDSGPNPRHAEIMVDEFETLLSSGGLEPPYILVGASFGGHISRLFANRHHEDIVGIVLLDARHEAIAAHMPPGWKRLEKSLVAVQKVMLLLSKMRLLPIIGRIAKDRSLPPAAKKLPLNMREAYLAVGYQSKYFQTNLAEFDGIAQSDAQVANAARFGDIPLVVIRHGLPEMFGALETNEAKVAEATWQELQNELAGLSTRSRLIVAESSGHLIQLDQPGLVAEAIRGFVSNVKQDG